MLCGQITEVTQMRHAHGNLANAMRMVVSACAWQPQADPAPLPVDRSSSRQRAHCRIHLKLPNWLGERWQGLSRQNGRSSGSMCRVMLRFGLCRLQ